ncbi:hypothetical protein AB1N83_008390 [Pleurotus pulmonarius]
MGPFALCRTIFSTYKYAPSIQKMPASSCTCKLEHVCAALTTTTHTVHTVHHHHHHHHYDERDEGRDAPSTRAVTARAFVNRLTPPITTSFFHKETINIFDGVEISDSASQLLETVTWRTEVYKYVTRFRPDEPNFEGKGGEIFIIMAHTGTAKMGRPFLLPEYVKAVRVPSSIIPMGQYPETGSGDQKPGDDWDYKINYTNTMPMFSNGGNNIFDFDAVYQNDFVRSKFQQTGDAVSGGVEFAAVNPRAINTSYAIHGLSVFKCLDPSAFPVKITFEAIVNDMGSGVRGSASKEVTISFDFGLKA